LLSELCFASPFDRSNFIGILLTSLLMSHFIGSKPAVMFNGNQSSIGKSTLAQTIALIRDGTSAGTVSYNENDPSLIRFYRIGCLVNRQRYEPRTRTSSASLPMRPMLALTW
jgi:hypothetical protein